MFSAKTHISRARHCYKKRKKKYAPDSFSAGISPSLLNKHCQKEKIIFIRVNQKKNLLISVAVSLFYFITDMG